MDGWMDMRRVGRVAEALEARGAQIAGGARRREEPLKFPRRHKWELISSEVDNMEQILTLFKFCSAGSTLASNCEIFAGQLSNMPLRFLLLLRLRGAAAETRACA